MNEWNQTRANLVWLVCLNWATFAARFLIYWLKIITYCTFKLADALLICSFSYNFYCNYLSRLARVVSDTMPVMLKFNNKMETVPVLWTSVENETRANVVWLVCLNWATFAAGFLIFWLKIITYCTFKCLLICIFSYTFYCNYLLRKEAKRCLSTKKNKG